MPLNMDTITDDDTELLLAFVRRVARLVPYDTVEDGEDAIASMNLLIDLARQLIERPGSKSA